MFAMIRNLFSSVTHVRNDAIPPRRRLLGNGLVAMTAAVLGKQAGIAAAQTPADTPPGPGRLATEGEVLRTTVRQGRPPTEPLDTMIRFERSDENNGRAMTHEVLSLMHEEKGKKSYPWTIYAHLVTHHVEGDACVLCSRLHKKGPGWSSGLHSEVFTSDRGVGLGVNIEMANEYTGPERAMNIGLNVLAKGPKDCQYGIQIHDDAGSFEKGIGLNGKGKVGLDLAGQFDVGVNAGKNAIRVNEGTCIELDGAGKVRIRYRDGRIEFLNGDKCVGHIDIRGEDHAI